MAAHQGRERNGHNVSSSLAHVLANNWLLPPPLRRGLPGNAGRLHTVRAGSLALFSFVERAQDSVGLVCWLLLTPLAKEITRSGSSG